MLQKNPIRVVFGGPWNGKVVTYITRLFVIFYSQLLYYIAIWYILWSFGTFCGHLVYFVVIWYNFSSFGMFYQEKSGNPATGFDN
jgi:hypothetical protein